MRPQASKFVILILLMLIINSCIKEDFNVSTIKVKDYTPGLAIPILNANLDLNDLSSIDTLGWNLHEDASKFMTLIYIQNEYFSADSFLKISDQRLYRNYIFTIDNSLPVGDSIMESYTSMLDFTSPDGDLFDVMYVKSGYLNIQINSADLNKRGKMVFRLPEVTKNGKMLVSQFNYSGIPRDTVNLIVDLSGYMITFTHVGKSNRLRTEFDVTAYNDVKPNNSPYHVSIEIKLTELKFSKVFGYFSARSFSFTDRIRISLFGGVESGKSYFEDPRLHLYFNNSVGIPVNLDILSFKAHSAITPPYDISITGLPNPIHINAPVIPGTSVKQDYLLDKSNSNIRDVINMVPTEFNYDIKGLTVPDPAQLNFIFDTSKINLDIEIELPLYGRISNYFLEDTFDFTLDSLEMFESVTFNMLLANGFPMESYVQLYFLDENKKLLDSLFVLPRDYLRSAIVDIPTGKVIKAVSHLYTIFFDRKRLDMINNCKHIAVKATLSSSNNGKTSIKIYSDYNMDIKLSALAKLKTD